MTPVPVFEAHEIITFEGIRRDLVGDRWHRELGTTIRNELLHKITTKLMVGERAVVMMQDDDPLRAEIARTGWRMGIPVFYLVDGRPTGEIVRGDGVAEVIDVQQHAVRPQTRPVDLSAFTGLTVIADVHGAHQALLAALRWARARNHHVLFLGDVVDHGPGTLEVADEVHRIVMGGEGTLIVGNHERKILRWLNRLDTGDGRDVHLNDGNRVTTDALLAMSPQARRRWAGRFRGLYHHGHFLLRHRSFVFAHAAVHPDFWEGRMDEGIENFAMFGSYETTDAGYRRTYDWVDAVPGGQTVVVGHEIRSRQAPYAITNDRGGTVVFLDMGSGKGGPLASADIRQGDEIANFNLH